MFKSIKAFSSFSVHDLASAKAFYSETLGCDVRETPEGLELHFGEVPVFVYHSDTNKPSEFTILNFVVTDIEEAVGALTAKGVQMEQYDMPYLKTDERGIARNEGGQKGPRAIVWFKDPSGNILSVLQDN